MTDRIPLRVAVQALKDTNARSAERRDLDGEYFGWKRPIEMACAVLTALEAAGYTIVRSTDA